MNQSQTLFDCLWISRRKLRVDTNAYKHRRGWACVVCRNIAKELRYGPTNLGGLGLVDPFLEQGICKIEYLTEHGWKNTPTGFLSQSCLQGLQLECGVFGDIFLQPCTPLIWCSVAQSWIQSAWEFCSMKGITISGLQESTLLPQRCNDVALMSAFHAKGYSPSTLLTLNRCRLFLRVISLSDITTADGLYLNSSILPAPHKRPTGSLCRSNFDWPSQGTLPQQSWTLWRDCLIDTFCAGDNGRLMKPLGTWSNTDHTRWDWYGELTADNCIGCLWRHVYGTWKYYKRVPQRSRRRTKFYPTGHSAPMPTSERLSHMVRVTVEKQLNFFHVATLSSSTVDPPVSPLRLQQGDSSEWSFASLISILSTCVEYPWLFSRLSFGGNIQDILHDFWLGTIVTGSDGSFLPIHSFGTASFKIESADGLSWIRCECIVPGDASLQNSYRSELAGLLGISGLIWGLWTLSKNTQLSSAPPTIWDIIVACDGKSALATSLLADPARLSSRFKHFDILSMIMGFWKQLPCSSFPVHVQSHLDDHCPIESLNRLERLNVEVDHHAKRFAYEAVSHHHPHICDYNSTYGFPVVRFKGQMLSTNLYRSLHDLCTRSALLAYWESRWGLSQLQSSKVAWSVFSRGMSRLPSYRRTFVMKWLSGQTSLGSRKRSRVRQRSCPRCPSSHDDESHCLRCMKVRPTLSTLLSALYESLENDGTHPHLVKGIRICTDLWLHPGRCQRPDSLLQDIHFTVRDTLCEHYSFGWLNFMQGIHLSSLTAIQDSYF